MDYIRLIEISNQYPNLPSYVRKNENSATLFGLYKETNKLDFALPKFEHITPIDNLNLRFIVGVKKNNEDSNIKYFTSQQFYSDMQASNVEGNPYFLYHALNINFFVLVDLEKFLSIFENLKEVESKQGIKMILNNFIKEDNSVEYDKLMNYLDWVLSKPTLDEIDTDGVILADKLGSWQVGDYDPIMMKWTFNDGKNNETGNNQNQEQPPKNLPEIKKWKLKRKRNLSQNPMRIYSNTEPKKSNRTGIIKEGDTFTGYLFQKINSVNSWWAIQTDPNGTPSGYAYQGIGDTVEPA